MTFDYSCPDCGFAMEVDFTPGRPAPLCMDHDSPAFSDPGDSAEAEYPFEVCPECGHQFDESKIMERGAEIAAEPDYEPDAHD